ncbi:MAG: extracellular solute-binding protein [Oscillospiraceae bacterium]|nr:extracellular solute-binding protein [Oscillospiraceae bacterium]
MKKVLGLLLAAVMVLGLSAGLTGCNWGGEPPEREHTPEPDYIDEVDVLYDDTRYGDEFRPWTHEDGSMVYNSYFVQGMKINELEHDYEHRVTTMMTVNWEFILDLQRTAPHHQFIATNAWESTFEHGEVTIQTVALGEHTNMLATGVMAGDPPDIVPSNEQNFPLWPARRLTYDLRNFRADLGLGRDDIFDFELMEQFSWAGTTPWAIVNGRAVTGFEDSIFYTVYNKTLFDERGVVTPFEHWENGNWNWSQFVQTARDMTTEGGFGFTGWGLLPQNGPFPMVETVDGGQVELTIRDPRYITWLTEVANLYQEVGGARNDWELQNWPTHIQGGIDAMVFTNINRFVGMRQEIERRNRPAQLRIAPLPYFDPVPETDAEGNPVIRSPITVWAYSLARNSRNPVGAAAYMRLETLVMQSLNEFRPHELYSHATEEELEMIRWYQDAVYRVFDPIIGVGDTFEIVEGHYFNSIYYGDGGYTVTAIIDAAAMLLQDKIDTFNDMARAAEEAYRQQQEEQQAAAPPPGSEEEEGTVAGGDADEEADE